MEQVVKSLVVYLKKNLLSIALWVFILLFVSRNADAGLLFKTNLDIVDSMAQQIAQEIPLNSSEQICLLSPDKSPIASFIKNSLTAGFVKRGNGVNFQKNDNYDKSISFIVLNVSVLYKETGKGKHFSAKSCKREVILNLNLNMANKAGQILFNRKFEKTSADTISISRIPAVEQKGRIIGKGIFITNKRRLSWLEPVVSVVVITIIGSLFYWVRSN
ncbi:hypothetical protein J7K93_11365 [bacterium]|nr:hypothetical protein [bacterium]